MLPKESYKQVYLFATSFVGIALAMFIVFSFISPKYQVKERPASFSFTQNPDSTSANPNLKLVLDPHSSTISFVKVKIYFDPDAIQLMDEVRSGKSSLAVLSITPLLEANESGSVEIILAQNPDISSSERSFEIANLIFERITGEPSEITIVDEDTQVVDNKAADLAFTSDYALIESD